MTMLLSACSASPPRAALRTFVPPRRLWAGARETLIMLRTLRRSRRQLLDLDAHRLRDAGLTREEALREATRDFWDAPAHWRR